MMTRSHLLGCLLATLAVLAAENAQAQVVQNCAPNQYLDRTAPGADRELTWDFSIVDDPERCLEVRTGQTVIWNGDLDVHPLGAQGGDMPNPILFHQNGSVTFNTPGTFGYKCLSHSPMIGAVKVVLGPPPTAAVPALSPWLASALTVLLLASGLVLTRQHRPRAPAGS